MAPPAAEPDRCVTRSCLLRLRVSLPRGRPLQCKWKAYAAEKSCLALRWEMRWALKDFGFEERGAQRLWKHVHDNWAKWTANAVFCGLDKHEDCGKSIRCARASLKRGAVDRNDVQAAAQEHWLSTAGFVAWFLFLASNRRQRCLREQAKRLALAPFDAALTTEAVEAWLGEALMDDLPHCPLALSMPKCDCLSRAWLDVVSFDNVCEKLWHRLVGLHGLASCVATKAVLCRVLRRLATCIDDDAHVGPFRLDSLSGDTSSWAE